MAAVIGDDVTATPTPDGIDDSWLKTSRPYAKTDDVGRCGIVAVGPEVEYIGTGNGNPAGVVDGSP